MPELKKYKMFIGGEWVDSDTKKTFETLNPEDNKPWAVVPEASANDVDKAVKAAQKAFEGDWPKILPRERAKFLRAIGNKLRDNAELLGIPSNSALSLSLFPIALKNLALSLGNIFGQSPSKAF